MEWWTVPAIMLGTLGFAVVGLTILDGIWWVLGRLFAPFLAPLDAFFGTLANLIGRERLKVAERTGEALALGVVWIIGYFVILPVAVVVGVYYLLQVFDLVVPYLPPLPLS